MPYLATVANPYVGVTGIVTPQEASALIEYWKSLGVTTHRLMIGVLVSGKTIRGEKVPNLRFPNIEKVEEIVAACNGAFTTVHYNTSRRDPFDEQLEEVLEKCGDVGGIQLNKFHPDKEALARFRERHPKTEIILQVNSRVIREGEKRGEKADHERRVASVAWYVKGYTGLADHALIDASGGTGTPLDTAWTSQLASSCFTAWLDCGIQAGVAGGLGPGAGTTLERIETPVALSSDSESAVRRPAPEAVEGEQFQDALDLDKARQYLKSASGALRPGRVNKVAQPAR